MNKIKICLALLSEEALEELQTKLEMAYTQECLRYCNQMLVNGKDNLPDPVKMRNLYELLNCDIKELGAS